MGQPFSAMADYSIFDKPKQSKSSHNGLLSFTDEPFSGMVDCYRIFSKPKPSKSRANRLLNITSTTLALSTLATVAVLVLVYYCTRFHDHLDDDIEKDHEDQEEENRQVYPSVSDLLDNEDQEEENRQVYPSVSDLLVVNETPSMDFIFNEGDERQEQHKILLVGEGDFSFSAFLASSSRSAELEKDHEDQEEENRQVYQSVSDLLVVNETPNMDFIFNEGDERQLQYKILLVGEGDFSFSASLASSSPSASNMVATSLNSRDFLYRNYQNAMKNINELRRKGCTIMHGIDATKMAKHDALSRMLFDRIIFNFPHAGFFKNESIKSQLRRNQLLVALFFENAKKMLKEGGEIHVRHKCNSFFQRWNIQVLASNVGLRIIEEVPFNFRDYPGYHTKYGFGGDKNFNCNPSKTYKFGF